VFIATNPTSPETNAVLLFTAQVDQANASRRSRCVASRIHGFLGYVLQFSGVVDTFVSSNPATAALVWGGIRVFILVSLKTFAVDFLAKYTLKVCQG